MKKVVWCLLVIIIGYNLSLSQSIYNSYIIKLKKDINFKDISDKIQTVGIQMSPIFGKDFVTSTNKKPKALTNEQNLMLSEFSQYYLLKIDSKNIAILESLKTSPEVLSLEPNYLFRIEKKGDDEILSNDPLYKKQWALNSVNVAEAWKKATGKGIIVGIVDTGIDYYHPDLINQLWINPKEDINHNGQFDPWQSDFTKNGITGDLNKIDDDGNGFADDVIGYDFVDQTILNVGESQGIDPVPEDEMGHGTSVAGVIAAENNNTIGITGIAFNSRIITARAFDALGNGESDDIAAAIVYAVLQGTNVLNFSFGEVYPSSIVHDAVKFAYANDVVMAASSGNNGWDLSHYPSDFEEVISAGASTVENKRWSLSNYGNHLTLIAPGYNVMTTSKDSSYDEKSGTSFSAPHITAAAALILEKDNQLSPSDVMGILQQSATDEGAIGWDTEYGSGILNIGNALNTIGESNISIISPENETYLDRKSFMIPVIGSVITPMFDSYQLLIGEGARPAVWSELGNEINFQIKNDTLGILDLTSLKDTTYTLRLKVNLKNNNSIEKRIYFQLISAASTLEFVSVNPMNAYFNSKKQAVIYAVTNYPAFVKIKYRKKASTDKFRYISEYQKFTNFHTILIPETFTQEQTMEAVAEAEISNIAFIEQAFEFTIPADYIPESSFHKKDYGFAMSYLLNDVKDFYANGKPCVVVNDISAGSWGKIKVFEFDSIDFYLRDSFNDTWIPQGIGESNGDGLNEIFATQSRESVLFQAKEQGASPFSKMLFVDTLTLNFWGEGMVDLNKDGKDELIAYSDTSFMAYTFQNGQYSLLALADPGVNLGTYPGFASGDFNNDGDIEICFGNRHGNIFIYGFSNGNFIQEYVDTSTFSSSEQYMASADIDGDKIPELIIGNFGSKVPFGYEDASDPIWTYRIFKAISPNKYEVLATEHIFGVRGGPDYKNGISTGDIDNDKASEIIISAFPNLYVLKWDKEKQKLRPVWNYPYTYSNSAIVYDFDKNGINEIGINTFSGTRFFELDTVTKPNIPLAFKGWAVDTNKAYFEWQTVDNATEYEILRMIAQESGGYNGYNAATTTETTFTIDTLTNLTDYEFVVRAVNPSFAEEHSNISNFVDIFTHKPIEPISIDTLTLQSNQLLVSFSGTLPANNLNAGDFELAKVPEGYIVFPTTAIAVNDTNVLLTFQDSLIAGQYILFIKSFRDRYNSPTIAGELHLTYPEIREIKTMFLTKLEVINKTRLALSYSEPVGKNSARDVENYTLFPFGSIDFIDINENDENSIIINLDESTPLSANGQNYTLTVKNVIAKSGIQITNGAGNTLGFVFYANNPDDPYVYPNPVKVSEAKDIFFANLPARAEVIIYTLEQEEIRRLAEMDGNGGVEWDGRDKNGITLGSGIYLYKVIQINLDGSRTESDLKKFMVVQ